MRFIVVSKASVVLGHLAGWWVVYLPSGNYVNEAHQFVGQLLTAIYV